MKRWTWGFRGMCVHSNGEFVKYEDVVATRPVETPSDERDRDAARYRWLRTNRLKHIHLMNPETIDAAVDAALKASTPDGESGR